MLIRDLIAMDAPNIQGEFRALESHWRTASSGKKFLRFGLRDVTGNLRAHAWEGRYQGPAYIAKNSKIRLWGRMRQYCGHYIADIYRAEIITEPENNPLLKSENHRCPEPAIIERLYIAIEELTIVPLRKFVFSVFSNREILQRFLLAPGSAKNHHSFPAGLALHSLECFSSVKNQSAFPKEELEIGMVAALLHDIGKIRTLTLDMRLSQEGLMLHHDDLTLELLAPYFADLDRSWPEGAMDLRYIFTFFGARRERFIPRLTIAEAVIAADRISAGIDNRKRAFAAQPHWRRHRRFCRGSC